MEKKEEEKIQFTQDFAEAYAQKMEQKNLDSNMHLLLASNAKQSQFHLDVGCGSGLSCLALSKFSQPGISIYGVDIASDMVTLAVKRFRNSGFLRNQKNTLYESQEVRSDKIYIEEEFEGTHMKFYVGDSAKLPFKDNQFDSYVSSLTYMHVQEDSRQNMLKQAYRVLKPGKRAAISVVGPRSNQFTWLDEVFEKNKDLDIEGPLKVGRQPQKLKQQLLKTGFKQVKYWSVDSVDSSISGEEAYHKYIEQIQMVYDLKSIDKEIAKSKIVKQFNSKFIEGDELLVFENIIFCIWK